MLRVEATLAATLIPVAGLILLDQSPGQAFPIIVQKPFSDYSKDAGVVNLRSLDLKGAPLPVLASDALDELTNELNSYEAAPAPYRSSPGIAISAPTGYGADRGRFFTGFSVFRTRYPTTDGVVGFGVGLGNAKRSIGVQLSYTAYSVSAKLGGDRPFGSGGFNLKLHRQVGTWAVAVGAESLINLGGKLKVEPFGVFKRNETEGTYYVAASTIYALKPDANAPFSRLAVTVGAGSGRFREDSQIVKGRFVVNPFASLALRVMPSTSLITEWSGRDLGVGLSIVPFKKLPLVITPAVRDLVSIDPAKPRFVFGAGLSF